MSNPSPPPPSSDIDSDDVCIICYSCRATPFEEMKEQLLRANIDWCGCKLAICERCWLEDCRMLCPVCQRKELNKKRQCHVCCSAFHLRDVDACDVCALGTCRNCKRINIETDGMMHFCSFIHQEVPLLASIECLESKARAAEAASGLGFCALGRVLVGDPTSQSTVLLIKDEVGDVGFTILLEGAVSDISLPGFQFTSLPSRGKVFNYKCAYIQIENAQDVTHTLRSITSSIDAHNSHNIHASP